MDYQLSCRVSYYHGLLGFTSYRGSDFGRDKMANESYAKVVGLGDMTMRTDVGCTLILREVRHIIEVCHNLVSIPALDKAGY